MLSSDIQGQVGLLGNHISYSLSPIIFEISAGLLNKQCSYKLYDLEQKKVASFLNHFWKNGGLGFNVTTPYKRLVASLTASSYKSVNTVYRSLSGWASVSTDGVGFFFALVNAGVKLKQLKNIVFLGSGGVVTSILDAIKCEKLCCQVFILRRNTQYDEELLTFSNNNLRIELKKLEPEVLYSVLKNKNKDTLLVQATNAPEKGDLLYNFVRSLRDYQGNFFDLAYNKRSALYDAAKKRELMAMDGRSMLVAQALESHKYWLGKKPSFSLVYEKFNKKVSSLV